MNGQRSAQSRQALPPCQRGVICRPCDRYRCHQLVALRAAEVKRSTSECSSRRFSNQPLPGTRRRARQPPSESSSFYFLSFGKAVKVCSVSSRRKSCVSARICVRCRVGCLSVVSSAAVRSHKSPDVEVAGAVDLSRVALRFNGPTGGPWCLCVRAAPGRIRPAGGGSGQAAVRGPRHRHDQQHGVDWRGLMKCRAVGCFLPARPGHRARARARPLLAAVFGATRGQNPQTPNLAGWNSDVGFLVTGRQLEVLSS